MTNKKFPHAEKLFLESLKGLTVENIPHSFQMLNNVNYTLFEEYFQYFRVNPNDENSEYCSDISFNKIYEMHESEQLLHSVCFDALSRIERALKANFAHAYAQKVGTHECFLNDEGFENNPKRVTTIGADIQESIRSSRDARIMKYSLQRLQNQQNVDYWTLVHIGEAVECVSFSLLKRMTLAADKSGVLWLICKKFRTSKTYFKGQLDSLVYLRNRSAHQRILWNHSVVTRPKLQKNVAKTAIKKYGNFTNNSVFRILVVLDHLLAKTEIYENWLEEKVMPILDACPLLKEGIMRPNVPGKMRLNHILQAKTQKSIQDLRC